MRSILCTCGDYSDEALRYLGKWWLEKKSNEDPVDHDALPSIEPSTSSTPSDEAQVQMWEWTMMIVQNHEFLVTAEYKAIKLRIHTCEEDHTEEENYNPGCIACRIINKGSTISLQPLQSDEDYKAEIVELYHTLFPTDDRRLDAQINYHDLRIDIGYFLKRHDAFLQVFADLSVIDSFVEHLEENDSLGRVNHVELDEVFWDVGTKSHLGRPQAKAGLHSFRSLETLVVSRGAVNKKVDGQGLHQDDELINTKEKQEELRKAFKEYFEHKHINYPACSVPVILFRDPFVEIKAEYGGSSGVFVDMTGVETGEGASVIE